MSQSWTISQKLAASVHVQNDRLELKGFKETSAINDLVQRQQSSWSVLPV